MRLSWDNYFMEMSNSAAKRSTCVRRQVGAVAINDKHRIIATGYNGTPEGQEHCTPETCLRNVMHIKSGDRPEVTRAVHAEQNIVAQAGDDLRDATVYCTTRPCVSCFKSLIASGVKRIVWKQDYADSISEKLMAEWGKVETTPDGYFEFIKHMRNEE